MQCSNQPSGLEKIWHYNALSIPKVRSTSVSVSALRYSSIQSDTLAQEQYLSRGNEAVWVVRQPFCFTDKNYKISVLEICSFFSSHIIISPISLQTVLSDLLSFLWTSCPWQVASPQKPGSRAYLQRTFLISTASLPSPHTLPVITTMITCLHTSSNIHFLPPTPSKGGNYFAYIILQIHMFTVFKAFPRGTLFLKAEHTLGSWINTA